LKPLNMTGCYVMFWIDENSEFNSAMSPADAGEADMIQYLIFNRSFFTAIWIAAIIVFNLSNSCIDASAQESKKQIKCKFCQDTGLMPCKRHEKKIKEIESVAIRCSENISCNKCCGTLRVPCTHCKQEEEAGYQAAKDDNLKWLAKMEEIDKFMKAKNVIHCESAHFILTYNIPSITVSRRAVKTHGGAHLYLERLEHLYKDVIKDLGAKDKDFFAKTHVMIWNREHELVRSARKYCRQSSNTKSFLLGAAPIFTIFYNRGHLHEEYELHQAVVHNVVHCLLSNVWNGIWPGNQKGGWIDAGYAHHYELHYFKQYGGAVRNYCYREGDTSANFRFGKWASSIRKEVDRKETLSFLTVSSKNIDMLEPRDHMYSWSYVDFILKKHPESFGKLALYIKERKPIATVLKDSMGITPFKFEENWKIYVVENYSRKEKVTSGPAKNKGK